MNSFLNIADTQMAAPVKAKHRVKEKRAAARMVMTEAEQKLHDQSKLLGQWRAWHRERQQTLLAGPFGQDIKKLKSFLRGMSPESAPNLIKLIKEGEWGARASVDVRHEILVMVGRGIMRVRERHGLQPFDDSLPGEAPTAYEIIRELLR